MGRQLCLVTWLLSSVLLYKDVGAQGIMCVTGLVPVPCDFPFPGFECISAQFICDGSPLCPDGEDEANCAGVFSCAAAEAPCHADPGLGCIPTTQYCDGIAQCPGGTDEYCGGVPTTEATTPTFEPPPITFLPFGVEEGDTETVLTVGEQNLVGPLELSVPIVFYNNNITSLYVSRFGLISPSNALNGVTRPNTDFPRDSDPRIPLIAPLWVEYVTRPGLRVLHRVTEDTETLKLVARMISERNSELSDYQPSFAVIVTLENPMIGLHGGDYTHQAVLSTDGKASFAAFIYNEPDDVHGIFIERRIGFDTGTSFQGVTVSTPRFSPNNLQRVNIFRIDGNCVTGIESDQVCGLNSISTGCSPTDDLATVNCLCNPGVNIDGCETDVELTCPAGAVRVPMCSEEYSVCVPSEIVCNGFADCTGGLDESPLLCGNENTLLPYGTEVGDLSFSVSSVRSFGSFDSFDVPIIFYRQDITEVFFSTNGLITFNDEFASHQIMDLPRTSRPRIPLLAPLWTDINRGGELFARLVSDQETLSTVKQMLLHRNPTLTDYNPSQALVATWHMAELEDGTTITYQAVVSTDGRASFAAFIYEEGGADKIQMYMEDKVIGFDAGDQIRGVVVHSLEFSGLDDLSDMNVFRIDGHCITTAYPGEVCDLDSYAVGCDVSLNATACRCYETVDLNTTTSNCDSNAPFVCEEGSVPSICPGGGDDSPYLGCFPVPFFCNLASDCPGGIDEINCGNENGFVKFGDGAGDETLKGRSGASGRSGAFTNIGLSVPIVYYQREEVEVFVSTDGYLAFRDPGEYFYRRQAPFPLFEDVPVVAALWADFSFTTEGVVYSRVTDDPTVLTKVSEMIAEANPALSSYEPSMAVIVTWFMAEHQRDDSIYNSTGYPTFQTVLSTDGSVSFAAIIYEDPDGVNGIKYDHQVGFNAGDRTRGINIAGENDIEAVYIREDVQGVNIFRIDGSCVTSVLPGEVCSLKAVATECQDDSVIASLCECQQGYIPYQETECLDINELCIGTDTECDVNAECINTAGSFLCVCNAGYSGDGFNCTKLPTLPAAAVVGIAVSLVVVFLITVSIVIIVILIMCRREVKKQREGIKAHQEDTAKPIDHILAPLPQYKAQEMAMTKEDTECDTVMQNPSSEDNKLVMV